MPSKFTSKTRWRDKLEKQQEAVVCDIPPNMQKQYGTGTLLIPKPLDVDALIRKVPKGKLVTPEQLREKLANEHHTDAVCALTTGIFIRIASEAAEEDKAFGKKKITPYWRVINKDGSLREKTPGGIEQHKELLEQEGFKILTLNTKKRYRVQEFEKYLMKEFL